MTVAPRGAWRACLAALGALAGAACAAWGIGHAGGGSAAVAAGAGVFAAVGVLLWRHGRVDSGPLAWDGAVWCFRGRDGAVAVMIDLDGWMLLRFDAACDGARAWLAVSAGSAGPAWHALRAAVYSRGPEPGS